MAIPIPPNLVQAARTGAAADVEALLAAVWPDAYRLARAILGDEQRAEDAAQEACIILYRTITTLRSAEAFRAWFYRIVVREATELKRRASRSELGSALPMVDDQSSSLDVWRALATLPQHLRDVVVLRYFEDLSSREIASVLSIAEGTVRFRLMTARRRLRPLLGDDAEYFTERTGEARIHAV